MGIPPSPIMAIENGVEKLSGSEAIRVSKGLIPTRMEENHLILAFPAIHLSLSVLPIVWPVRG